MPLNLSNLTVTETKYDAGVVCYYVETIENPGMCPKCRNMFPSLYGHGSRRQFFHDTPAEGMKALLRIERKRFKCRDCGVTFDEPLEIIHPDHDMTKRLAEFIIKQSFRNKFIEVSRLTGPTEKTIRNVFRSYVDHIRDKYRFETPEILGIDEIHVRTARCIITNLGINTILDMLPTRNKSEIVPYLLKMDRSKVKLVSMDMWQPYRDAVNIAFPNANIVVDRFHVQKMSSEIMTKVRISAVDDLPKAQRKSIKRAKHILQSRNFNLTEYELDMLASWSEFCPILGDAYEVKERFMDIWFAEDRRTAEHLYDAWKHSIPDHLKPHFKPITTAFKNWHVEIFNWWDHKVTNAYTEAVNGKIRDFQQEGKGYSFDVLRAKIICNSNLHKIKNIPPKIDKTAFARMIFSDSTVNYGIDISTLLELNELDSD